MSEHQQPKEYIITEKELQHAEEHHIKFIDDAKRIRSRPHPAPAFKRCCDSCINVPCKVLNRVPCLAQEKQENVCEENGCTDIENCDEICQHSRLFSPLQMQEAKNEAARAAREDFAKALNDFIDATSVSVPDEESEEADDMLFTGEMRAKIESLRGERDEH